MRIILNAATVRDLIVDAIQQVIDSNNEQIESIQIFDLHDSPKCQQENAEGIKQITKQNEKLIRIVDKLKTVDKFTVSTLKSKLNELWFERHMPKHINVSYDTKLQANGVFDCLIKLGFDKLTECNK